MTAQSSPDVVSRKGKTMSIRRHSPTLLDYDRPGMEECDEGKYVDASDYDELVKFTRELCKQLKYVYRCDDCMCDFCKMVRHADQFLKDHE